MAANLWVCGGNTRRANSCWRGSWVREAVRSLVSDSSATPRPEREAEGR